MGGYMLQRFIHRCYTHPQWYPLCWEALPFTEASREMCASHLIVSAESSLPAELTFLPRNRWRRVSVFVTVWVCSYSSWFPHLPCLSLALAFLVPGSKWWLKEQNKTQCTGFCSPQALISIFLAWPTNICIHLQHFLIVLWFRLSKQSFAVVWLFGPFAQSFGRNFPAAFMNHRCQAVFRYAVKKVYFCSSSKWQLRGALKFVPGDAVLSVKMRGALVWKFPNAVKGFSPIFPPYA